MKRILQSLGLENLNPGAWSGEGWSGTNGPAFDTINPATGKAIARVCAATRDDYQAVVRSARAAFDEWRRVPAPQRGEAVRLVGERLRVHKDALGSLVSLEMGKIKAEGDGEVQEMIDIADFAVGQSRMLYGKTMHSERPLHRMYEQWHPLGVVGIISAFNFPVAVWSWNAFIAAVCGNACIWKPSPKTPLCAIAVQRICNEVFEKHGFPPVFQLFIDPGSELADEFVRDERIDLVSFTGSTAVGRKVGEKVAARMGKVLLEMGGNNAIVVDEHANMDLAVPAIVFGAVGTAGQRCTSTRRVLVHESRMDDLVGRLKSAYGQVSIGDPLDGKTLMGPLIDKESATRYSEALETVRKPGGEILYGGKVLDKPGNFVEPAIVRAENDWAIVQQETFAPILYVIPFDTLDEAIAMHNGVVQGLSSAIFTDNLQHAERFLSAMGSDCGIANVNIGTSGAEIGGAFGGEKETGGGREAGSDSWKAYMRRQTNTINWSRELPLAQGIRFDVGDIKATP
ncbi:MAG: aldehyde dehydrogenase family protein [Gammaproteobacteria bacterium]|nr:aldehyde dehydrogenase family protein [Gammaproteobacteria bacterium]